MFGAEAAIAQEQGREVPGGKRGRGGKGGPSRALLRHEQLAGGERAGEASGTRRGWGGWAATAALRPRMERSPRRRPPARPGRWEEALPKPRFHPRRGGPAPARLTREAAGKRQRELTLKGLNT